MSISGNRVEFQCVLHYAAPPSQLNRVNVTFLPFFVPRSLIECLQDVNLSDCWSEHNMITALTQVEMTAYRFMKKKKPNAIPNISDLQYLAWLVPSAVRPRK